MNCRGLTKIGTMLCFVLGGLADARYSGWRSIGSLRNRTNLRCADLTRDSSDAHPSADSPPDRFGTRGAAGADQKIMGNAATPRSCWPSA